MSRFPLVDRRALPEARSDHLLPEARTDHLLAAGSQTPHKQQEQGGTKNLVLLSVLLFLTVPLAIAMLAFPSITDSIGRLQLLGVFVINFLVTLHVVPVPGVSALGQAVIVRQASSTVWPRWAIGLTGGLGMGLGELSPFYIGRLGSQVASNRELKAPGPLRPAAEWLTRTVSRLMERWAWALLFVLSAVPNPFFEVAGLSAGSTRLSLWQFLPPTLLGKLLRGLILVYAGSLFLGL